MSNNKKQFTALMYGLFNTYGQNFNQTQVDVYWNVLSRYSHDQVTQAFNQYLLIGKRFPRPADIIEIIDNASGNRHMEASEAWAIALSANDEANTVVWTDEMHKAWVVAKNVMDLGDEVGARRAFIESYGRLIQESIFNCKPISVTVSLGFDKTKRIQAINNAVFTGLLSEAEAKKYLPKPENTFAMLENKQADEKSAGIPAGLFGIKAMLKADKLNKQEKWKVEQSRLHETLRKRYEQQLSELNNEAVANG